MDASAIVVSKSCPNEPATLSSDGEVVPSFATEWEANADDTSWTASYVARADGLVLARCAPRAPRSHGRTTRTIRRLIHRWQR